MKFQTAILFSVIAILFTGFILQANAAQMTAFLVPERDRADPTFTSVRFVNLRYEPGSPISEIFKGKTERIKFTVNDTESGMGEIISTINRALLSEHQSTTQIEKAVVTYTATLRGDDDRLSISYKVEFTPTISRYVLENSAEQGTVIDLNWRGLVVTEPLVINTQDYGQVNINYPVGAIQAINPDFAEKLLNTNAKSILTDPLLNFEEFGASMDRWHFLFDPTGSQAGAAGQGYEEEGGGRVVSVYSLGESSFREGTHETKQKSASVTIDNTEVDVQSSTPPPSGQIQIVGFSRIQKVGNDELAFVSAQAPEGFGTATGGFPLQVLLVLGGMMGAVAVFVLLKARK